MFIHFHTQMHTFVYKVSIHLPHKLQQYQCLAILVSAKRCSPVIVHKTGLLCNFFTIPSN